MNGQRKIWLIQKSKIKNKRINNICTIVICTILTIINIAFMCNNGVERECIVSFSSDFSNEVVLKKEKDTGSTVL